MGFVRNTSKRERWYAEQLEQAETPEEEFNILRRRLQADIKRLPEGLRYGAYTDAVAALAGLIESVADAVEYPNPIGGRV